MRTLYLAGPIMDCTDQEATGWRQSVRVALGDRYVILDPMARDYRGKEEETDPSVIVDGDLTDIQVADVVLVRAQRPSWGTAMEIVYAHRMGKEIVVWVTPGETVSPWLRYHATAVDTTLGDAIVRLAGEAPL